MSIIVVEIDTRKGSEQTLFDSPVSIQTEHAKQFWKTLILHPHMESRLYSKEISQVLKANTLKETTIDNSRKPPEIDKKTEEFYERIRILNQVDEVKKIQNQLTKIDRIRSMQKRRHARFVKLDNIAKANLSKSESNLKTLIAAAEMDGEQSDEYECNSDGNEKNLVKNLDGDDFFDDDDDEDEDFDFDYSNNYDSYGKFINNSHKNAENDENEEDNAAAN